SHGFHTVAGTDGGGGAGAVLGRPLRRFWYLGMSRCGGDVAPGCPGPPEGGRARPPPSLPLPSPAPADLRLPRGRLPGGRAGGLPDFADIALAATGLLLLPHLAVFKHAQGGADLALAEATADQQGGNRHVASGAGRVL